MIIILLKSLFYRFFFDISLRKMNIYSQSYGRLKFKGFGYAVTR